MATDPELVLLVEAATSAKTPAYHVAFARFGNLAMTVKDGDKTSGPATAARPAARDGKYYLRWRAEEMLANP